MNTRAILLATLALSGVFFIVVVGVIMIPRWLYPSLSARDLDGVTDPRARIELQQAQSRLANDARSALLQGSAGLVVVVGAAATWRQVQVNREGQITERFTRAVEQLGSENVDVRIGGLYALERIAKNSSADRNSIQFLLGAFVRNHAPWPVGGPDAPEHPTATVDEQLLWMRVRAPDVQVAAGVLGRRPPAREDQVIYLSRVDLRSVSLRGARFTGARLRYSNLTRAILAGAKLNLSDLTAADLRQAFLEHANLHQANLSRAYMQRANMRGADLSYADLRGTNLDGAILEGTVLTGARADVTTIWPTELTAEMRHELGIIEVSCEES